MEEQKKKSYKRLVLEFIRLASQSPFKDFYKSLPYMECSEEEKARRQALCDEIDTIKEMKEWNYKEFKREFLRNYEKTYTSKDIEDIQSIIDKYKRKG